MKSLFTLAQRGFEVKRVQEEEKRRVEEEKRWIEEEERRLEKARAELKKERDGILSKEFQKFFVIVEDHIRKNEGLLVENYLHDITRISEKEGEEGLSIVDDGFGLVKVTTKFTVGIR